MLISPFMMLLTTVQLLPCQMVHQEVNPVVAPAPSLSVLQAKEEYFLGDAVTLVCTTPPTITGKRLYQLFGEAGWALSEFSCRNNYTHKFILSQMQHRGPHFCSYSLQKAQRSFRSPPSEKLMIKIEEPLPQPLLMVESPLGEVMRGDLLRIICKAPGNATERRFHFYRDGGEFPPRKAGSENNTSEREDILKNAMVLHFLHSGPQHSGNFTCKYEEKIHGRWIPSLTSQAMNVNINSNKRDSPLQSGDRLTRTSQTACRSLSTLQPQSSTQHHEYEQDE
ncbi:leukotriene B4 receptor 2 isoform X5 [Apteryx rowi]|uniref:leukotriene B4 receptor 2 isoform X5 n=1 Tax=Apteryx rowi TaxID=308060 RepID=UPI000E1D25E4|nr:leukotriene B4 receptor 2 isoform X5 [Apteryx rowi]